MIKVLLVSLNAKFIHSAAAPYYLKSYCDEYNIKILESTVNNNKDSILSDIYSYKADVVGFSCYIWNISMILQLVSSLRKISPDTIIILGGPEASFENESDGEILFDSGADVVVLGEGEKTFKNLLELFSKKDRENLFFGLSEIKGIAYKDGVIKVTGMQNSLDLLEITFPYDDIDNFANRIIYYESSRGCPFSCKYCLSSSSPSVRFVPIDEVIKNLSFFLKNKVPQVKFVDRTFNCDLNRANRIWRFLIENDNGTTNFHFEISAEMLDSEAIQLLSGARKGLFQFEAGIQTANSNALKNIARKADLCKLMENVKKVKKLNNIHQHLDLIAGLPGESYESFGHSFDFAYNLQPEMLQLGFLKILKGSRLRMEAVKYGLVYEYNPPYEVLFNREISYESLVRLKSIEEVVDIYYNSGRYVHTLKYLVSLFESPFSLYEHLAAFWISKGYNATNHSKFAVIRLIYDFAVSLKESNCVNVNFALNLIRFDLFQNENEKTLPEWLMDEPVHNTPAIRDFYRNNLEKYFGGYERTPLSVLSRMFPVKKFDYDIPEWIGAIECKSKIIAHDTFVLFVYPKHKTKGLIREKGEFYKIW